VARIGLLGGTFNPPHIGHLVCAQEAHAQLGLDRVLLVPVYAPPHKAAEADPGVEQRVELCRRTVAGDERFEVTRVEADVPGPSFTVDTLRRLHDHRPEDELTFILGADQAHSLRAWREPEAVLALSRLGIAARADLGRDDVCRSLAGLPGVPERLDFFDMPRLDISSSLVRARVAAGRPIRYLVPDGVARHIAEAGLYREGAGAGTAAPAGPATPIVADGAGA
jgi:nicotinate-nucleotide adenylyltransferase